MGSHPFPNLVILQNGRLLFMLRKRLIMVGLLKEKNTYKIDEISQDMIFSNSPKYSLVNISPHPPNLGFILLWIIEAISTATKMHHIQSQFISPPFKCILLRKVYTNVIYLCEEELFIVSNHLTHKRIRMW